MLSFQDEGTVGGTEPPRIWTPTPSQHCYLRGRFVIPDFQRDFEWTPQDVQDLMRSIFLDYYIGSLLPPKGKPATFAALACEPV